jgi:hypothetical protein
MKFENNARVAACSYPAYANFPAENDITNKFLREMQSSASTFVKVFLLFS